MTYYGRHDLRTPYDFWNSVVASVLSYGTMEISKMDGSGDPVPRPENSGLFRRSIGEQKGQVADWRASIPGSKRGVHVVEFEDHYSAHVDRYDPNKDPIRHLLMDSPKTILSALVAGVASLFLYSMLGRKK